jgi:hypothetical protein
MAINTYFEEKLKVVPHYVTEQEKIEYDLNLKYSDLEPEQFLSYDKETRAKAIAEIVNNIGYFRSTNGLFTLRIESKFDGIPNFFLKLFGGNVRLSYFGNHRWYSMSQDVQELMMFVYKYLNPETQEEFAKKYNTCKNRIYPLVKNTNVEVAKSKAYEYKSTPQVLCIECGEIFMIPKNQYKKYQKRIDHIKHFENGGHSIAVEYGDGDLYNFSNYEKVSGV